MNTTFLKILSIIPFVVLAFGLIGNLLNICIFVKRKMRSSSSTFRFLMYLSTCDLFVLLFGASRFLIKSDFSFDIRDFSLFSCTIEKFLIYTFIHMSSCISMAVNVDRAQIIFKLNLNQTDKTHPSVTSTHVTTQPKSNQNMSNKEFSHKKSHCLYSKTSLVDYVVMLIVIFSIVVNLHFLIFLKNTSLVNIEKDNKNTISDLNSLKNNKSLENITISFLNKSSLHIFRCVPVFNSNYEVFLLHAWFWIDLFIYSIIPFVLMAVCSTIIIIKLTKINKGYMSRLSLNQTSTPTTPITTRTTRRIYSRKLRKNIQTSLMLVSSNLYFLLTMLLFWLWFLGDDFQMETFESDLKQSYIYVMLYSNNAFGIVFYTISSSKFRDKLFKLITFDLKFKSKKNTSLKRV